MGTLFQKAFNESVSHLIKQGDKSIVNLSLIKKGRGKFKTTGICCYRGPNNTSCGIGCLIKDPHYKKDLEKQTVDNKQVLLALHSSGWEVFTNEEGKVNMDFLNFLRLLQGVHDTFETDQWVVRWRKIASMHDLNSDVIDNADPQLLQQLIENSPNFNL